MTRWLSIPQYAKETGLARANVDQLINDNKITFIKTEGGGQVRIMIEDNKELDEIRDELVNTKIILKRLCNHLGIKEV